jgi:hypothetical protein
MMGLLDRVRTVLGGARAGSSQGVDVASVSSGLAPKTATVDPAVTASATLSFGDGCVELSGTTTNSREHCQRVFAGAGYLNGGLLYRDGALVAEPTNPVDSDAVAVQVEGTRVGYLPAWVAAQVRSVLADGTSVPVQLWGKENDGDVRVRAFAWLGAGEPAWQYDATKPAPVTTAEKKEEQARSAAHLREQRLAAGGETTQTERNALVRGKHYTEWPEGIRELKRAGQHDQALVLLYELIDAAERDARRQGHRAPAPWYTEQAAIIHRKLKEYEREIAVLERYRATHPQAADAFTERLAKATTLGARTG